MTGITSLTSFKNNPTSTNEGTEQNAAEPIKNQYPVSYNQFKRNYIVGDVVFAGIIGGALAAIMKMFKASTKSSVIAGGTLFAAAIGLYIFGNTNGRLEQKYLIKKHQFENSLKPMDNLIF